MSWTLGGCPSPNLRLASWLLEDKGTLKDFLIDWLGEDIAEGVFCAQQKLSDAFSHYPFYIGTLYFGPQNFGPMAPFFLKKTEYHASMVGYPYDDIEWWSGIYPIEKYEMQYQKLVEGWKAGVEELYAFKGKDSQLDEMILMAQVVLFQYESAYHHIQFVIQRDAERKDEMLSVVQAEMETVQRLLAARCQDSRIGYESSNQYFYTLQDLKEKLINLAYCEETLM